MVALKTHIGALVDFIDSLPETPVRENGRNVHPSCAFAVANLLEISATSINFGKTILWIGAFIEDGRQALSRSSLDDSIKNSALDTYHGLSDPFRFPFGGQNLVDFKKARLTEKDRAYISLLDRWVVKEHPIIIPDDDAIRKCTDQLRKFVEEFSKFDLPQYIKDDFRQNIGLYILVAEKMPLVAHRLIAEESSNLVGWLLSTIPDDAKRTVKKAATVINVLVAAFIAPAEAYSAADTYYEWYLPTAPTQAALEATTAPKALPKPEGRPPLGED